MAYRMMRGNHVRNVVLGALLFSTVPAMGAEQRIEGIVQGYTCVTRGISCPTDQEDAVIASERIFVILTDDNDYYFVPNLDRAILARHIIRRVRVTGDVDKKYKSVRARVFEVRRDDAWKMTWTKEMEDEMRKRLLLGQ